MRTAAFLVLLTAVSATCVWALTARVQPTWLEEAYPDRRDELYVAARPLVGPGASPLLLEAGTHAVFVSRLSLVLVPAMVGAIALGLFRREAARTLVKFSSPTIAFLAKKLFIVAFVSLAVFAITPIAVPYWLAYAASGAMAIATAAYVENIPVKI